MRLYNAAADMEWLSKKLKLPQEKIKMVKQVRNTIITHPVNLLSKKILRSKISVSSFKNLLSMAANPDW